VAKRKPLPLPELSADIRKLFEVLNEEADLAAVLIAGSYLDECLASMLHRFLVPSRTAESLLSPTTGALGSFSVRVDLSYALGLINRFAFKDLKTLGEIRNVFAHSHLTLDFSSPAIQKLTSSLTYLAALDKEMNLNNASVGGPANLAGIATSPRDRFTMTVVTLASHLLLLGLGIEPRQRSNAFVQAYSKNLSDPEGQFV
jgi:DNA-binding MltR family transcriptional regulator